MRIAHVLVFSLAILCVEKLSAENLQNGVRGVATRAPKEMKIDGDLSEFRNAFCTPVEYWNDDLRNRAAQFFYMWDDEAFYAALRTIDAKIANFAPDDRLWEGDAVEWYFDTRQNDTFRSHDWPKEPNAGAVHCYWTGMKDTNVQARFCLRPGFLEAIQKIGVEVGSKRTKVGMDVEFKLPWKNFPDFKPKNGAIIALDAELCYSDGDPDKKKHRVFRSFVFGSPLSVQQPANLSKIQLVEEFKPEYWEPCGAVMAPFRCDTPWGQDTKPNVKGIISVPPNRDEIGKIVFRINDLKGRQLGDFEAKIETFEAEGNFRRAIAMWPSDLAQPGAHQVTAIIYSREGKELSRIAPRLVSVNWVPGY